eukprot:SAG31_NODE_4054_length_3633_cov_1.767402_4_plen_185_part_00
MTALAAILGRLGYELIVPNGPHKTTGPAQGAAGLDADDSYGWWRYSSSNSHGGEAIGLEATEELIDSLFKDDRPAIAGVVGFSQGGAVAAYLANRLGVTWSILFSPVFVPGHHAQCDCPTLVAFDPADEVRNETQQLIGELPADKVTKIEHSHGHRLPPASETQWYSRLESFVKSKSEHNGEKM